MSTWSGFHDLGAAGAVFNALPAAGVNTLNTGDNLQDSANDGTLNQTISATGINPPLATGVTINGVSKANITNATTATGGFQGNITGLLIENNQLSSSTVQIGAIGQGLKTLLTDINISGFSGTNGAVVNAAILAASLGDATKNINVGLTGTLGGTAAGAADKLVIGNDVGGGTTAAPNLTYGTMTLTAANTVDLQLQTGLTAGTGGVDGLKNIVVKGAGDVALGQDAAGNHQFLASYDSSASTGAQFITGASAGNTTNAFATTANPSWLFGSAAGLLNDPGAGSFALTNVVLGSGMTILDISSASVANVAALKTAAGTGVTLNAGDEIIVNSTVADTTSATTFANIKGFTTLGVGGATAANGAGGTMNMANLPGFSTIIYQTLAQANTALTITNQTNPLTVNVEDNSAAGNSIISTATGGPSFTLVMGNNFKNTTDILGTSATLPSALNLTGNPTVIIDSEGGTSLLNNSVGLRSTELIPGPRKCDGEGRP